MVGCAKKLSFVTIAALLVLLGACDGGSDGSNNVATALPTEETLSTGVITGFGSVHVNGVNYATSSVEVTMDGLPATESQLQVGHYVEVKGHAQGATQHADVIRYHNVLEGPISSIDTTASSFVAMGQQVLVSLSTSLAGDIQPASIEGLVIGDIVEVSGIVPVAGAIDATRVDIKPDGGPYDVTGYVSHVSQAMHRFNINDLVIDYSSADLEDFPSGDPVEGDLVLVKGFTFDPDATFAAIRVELRSDDWFMPASGDRLDIEGVIGDFASQSNFKVGVWGVTTTSETKYEHGTAIDLANNVQVRVKGTADENGVLVARVISFIKLNYIRIVAQVDSLVSDSSIGVIDLTVATDNATRYEDNSQLHQRDFDFNDLVVGTWIDLRGYEEPAGSGSVLATRVVRINPTDVVRLRGPFVEPVTPNFHLLSVLVKTTDATRFLLEGNIKLTPDEFFSAAEGKLVEAWGNWNGTALTAEKVEIKFDD